MQQAFIFDIMFYPLRATFYYQSYEFSRPATLTSEQFNLIKLLLSENPKHRIAPNTFEYFIKGIKGLLIWNGVVLVVDAFLWAVIPKENAPKWFVAIFTGAIIGTIINLIGFLITVGSYITYRMDLIDYYKDLKKDIQKADSYVAYIAKSHARYLPKQTS